MATNAGMIPPFSQPHALVVADIDGDGVKDIVTGKTFYAHPPAWAIRMPTAHPCFTSSASFAALPTGELGSAPRRFRSRSRSTIRNRRPERDGKVDIAVARQARCISLLPAVSRLRSLRFVARWLGPHLDLEHGKVTIHRTIDREVDDEARKQGREGHSYRLGRAAGLPLRAAGGERGGERRAAMARGLSRLET